MSDQKTGSGRRGPHGPRLLGDLGGGSGGGPAERGPAPEADDAEGRSAQLPVELPPSSWAELPVVPQPSPRGPGASPGAGPAGLTPLPRDARRSELGDRPLRESLLLAMRQQRTTAFEIGDLAHRLSVLAPGFGEASLVVRQLAVSFAIALAVVLLATMAIAAGTLRLVLGVLAGTVATTLAVLAALRLVSRLGSRRGARVLPGSALIWVGGVVFVVAASAVAFTWGVSEVTRPLVAAQRRAAPAPSASASAAPAADGPRADAAMRRGVHANLGRGVLYAPPGFSAPDGLFDVIVHYHGNTELVEESVAAAGVNALVVVINLGDGSDRYSKPLQNQVVFDQLLGSIEATAESGLGLRAPRIHRVALSAWSAGYGALYHILSSRSRLELVDAVLLMDSMHASFAMGSETEVHPIGIKPFVAFARRAVAGEKLMVLTHSAIETEGYASTTQTTDALLAALGLTRQPPAAASAGAAPVASTVFAPVTLPVAVRAFPTGERRGLVVTSEVHQGNLHVLACQGNGKGDHIAHLAQMSVSVLPPLIARWR